MRLKVSRSSAEEMLVAHINEGYELRRKLWQDYTSRRDAGMFTSDEDLPRLNTLVDGWANNVLQSLGSVFPTPLEANLFANRYSSSAAYYQEIDQRFGRLYYETTPRLIERLQEIFESNLLRYTDLPLTERLYVEDIDSFRHVRDVNPAQVSHALKDGYLDLPEDEVQIALEQILDVPFHKKDWGGEINDLYTANIVINGARRSTAFLLKGHGLRRTEMRIADCGKNGDQIVRLFQSPAELFVVQFVGAISEMVISDVQGKIRERRLENKEACFLIMDGQDTARLLFAYGKLQAHL